VDEDSEPLYSFGHGLTYTSFEYGVPNIVRGGAGCEVEVTNTGERAGRSVVQLYVRRLRTTVWPRTLELHAFESVDLAPGESRTVTFALGDGQLAQVGADLETAVLPGSVEIRVAGSARGALGAVPAVLDIEDIRG
jgi:beta-glucosidase